jgi:hypothetical protein
MVAAEENSVGWSIGLSLTLWIAVSTFGCPREPLPPQSASQPTGPVAGAVVETAEVAQDGGTSDVADPPGPDVAPDGAVPAPIDPEPMTHCDQMTQQVAAAEQAAVAACLAEEVGETVRCRAHGILNPAPDPRTGLEEDFLQDANGFGEAADQADAERAALVDCQRNIHNPGRTRAGWRWVSQCRISICSSAGERRACADFVRAVCGLCGVFDDAAGPDPTCARVCELNRKMLFTDCSQEMARYESVIARWLPDGTDVGPNDLDLRMACDALRRDLRSGSSW